MGIRLSIRSERFPIRGGFRISRGSRAASEVVVAEIADGALRGWGECLPYGRYGETVAAVVAALEALAPAVEAGLDRAGLAALLPAGAARNALDCALWDLEAKRQGRPVWELAGLPPPQAVDTALTLRLDAPAAMGQAAAAAAACPLLKVKLGGGAEDLQRLEAVRAAAPAARLMVDANEGWTLDQLTALAPPCARLGVELIEQPLPATEDEALRGLNLPVPLGADESFHDRRDLPRLRGLYQVINLKLDKTGGLSEALAVRAAAEAAGFRLMVGCMVATSLSMAPALLLAGGAAFVDLDGPLLLETDRRPGLRYDGTRLYPPPVELWG